MKKTLKLLRAMMICGLIFAGVGCSSDDDPEESCQKPDQNVGTCSADDITICCNDDEVCYYIYKGTEYAEADLADLAAACASGSAKQAISLQMELDSYTLELINQARKAAVCQ